ncbi:enoyl-CoA hydratase [Rhodococcus spelaei]|uniref:Enoyl-CoA hydratase n=1 Tax=Rhodococcus spelaei TaxID=2546320 RepID=A0A541B8Z4_9NOCA|nr:enoyl-CoA hydratase-related protein [Rhodococcus spelaei]TQF68786.1 enoyl-CoA hydratase [Rhodococcus spelaei]
MQVRQEVRGSVLVVHLEREDKRNAINAAMAAGIDAALNRLDDDPDLWVGVLTGTPTVFCAGTDIKEGSGELTPRGGEYGIIRRQRQTPLIAAVEGQAFGGGFEIALACDLIVAAGNAVFGLPESLRGLVATSGALFRAPRALPLNIARELLITGNTLTAQRAFDLGVVNEVTTPGGALDAALAMAAKICASSPTSVRESLRAVNELTADEDAFGWEVTDRAKRTVTSSADMREGIDAFFERRAPRWSGR